MFVVQKCLTSETQSGHERSIWGDQWKSAQVPPWSIQSIPNSASQAYAEWSVDKLVLVWKHLTSFCPKNCLDSQICSLAVHWVPTKCTQLRLLHLETAEFPSLFFVGYIRNSILFYASSTFTLVLRGKDSGKQSISQVLKNLSTSAFSILF